MSLHPHDTGPPVLYTAGRDGVDPLTHVVQDGWRSKVHGGRAPCARATGTRSEVDASLKKIYRKDNFLSFDKLLSFLRQTVYDGLPHA